jgi:putative glutamine amidotransferase
VDAPIIGITTSYAPEPDASSGQISLDANYVSAVERAGAVPLIIPTLSSLEAMRIALSCVHGLIMPGGPGINDGLIGTLPDDLAQTADERTQSDLYAFEAARQRDMPMLGICYGMQFINARFGGTIYGDVQQEIGVSAHHPKRTDHAIIEHGITIESGSRLRDLIQQPGLVNSYHIQAVADVGQGLSVSIRSDDGLVEGIESDDGRIVGVQFHPEKMADTAWESLFTDLVARCHS